MYNFKYGYIYKITNLLNNKIYIGQVYNKSIKDRFIRHCKSAKPDAKCYLARAIYKYGKENFSVEQVEECYSVNELNMREKYWIKYYNSTDKDLGYNLTDGGEGGNTYLCKSSKEMSTIKSKISKANSGKNNGNSTQLKIKSVKSGAEYYFNTLAEALQFFNMKNGYVLVSRAKQLNTTLFRDEWLVAFEFDNYKNYNLPNKHSRGTKVKLIDLSTNTEKLF